MLSSGCGMNGAVMLRRLSQCTSEKSGICFTVGAAGLTLGSSVRRVSIAERAGSENCSSPSGHGMSVTAVPIMTYKKCRQQPTHLIQFFTLFSYVPLKRLTLKNTVHFHVMNVKCAWKYVSILWNSIIRTLFFHTVNTDVVLQNCSQYWDKITTKSKQPLERHRQSDNRQKCFIQQSFQLLRFSSADSRWKTYKYGVLVKWATEQNQSTWRKTQLSASLSLHIPHALACNETQTSTVPAPVRTS